MGRATEAFMALLVWHALDLGLICAFDLSLKYHVTNDPSGVAFVYGLSTDVVPVVSSVQCGVFCLRSQCVGYSYQDNVCTVEGVGNSSGLTLVGSQLFRQWTVNRAFMRPVYASGHYYPGSYPENAVNDQSCVTWSRTSPGCCYVTYQTDKAWLVIDLGASMRVHVVGVGTKNMVEAEVRVGQELLQTGDFSSYELLGHCSTGVTEGWMKFSKRSGIVGRYVSIQQMSYANFFLCDVIVLADD